MARDPREREKKTRSPFFRFLCSRSSLSLKKKLTGPRHEAHQVQPPLRQRRRRHGQEEEPELAVEDVGERRGIFERKKEDEEEEQKKSFSVFPLFHLFLSCSAFLRVCECRVFPVFFAFIISV